MNSLSLRFRAMLLSLSVAFGLLIAACAPLPEEVQEVVPTAQMPDGTPTASPEEIASAKDSDVQPVYRQDNDGNWLLWYLILSNGRTCYYPCGSHGSRIMSSQSVTTRYYDANRVGIADTKNTTVKPFNPSASKPKMTNSQPLAPKPIQVTKPNTGGSIPKPRGSGSSSGAFNNGSNRPKAPSIKPISPGRSSGSFRSPSRPRGSFGGRRR